MFRDEAIEVAPTWAQDDHSGTSYREIDKQLRRIARKQAALDAEEAKWLREAERHRIWRKLGFSTALEYLEDVFGITPRTAMERLRVAKELGELPNLEAELASGGLPWSAARELTRVMTPATEARWLERARGRNAHDIQALVSGLKKGDDPDAPKNPELMTRRLVLELPPALDALFERTRLMLETERGEHLEDVTVFEAMCMRTLDPGAPPGDSRNASPATTKGKAPKPMQRIVNFKCDDCLRGWREGRGRLVPITAADLALAACDAELVRELAPASLASDAASDRDATGDDAADGSAADGSAGDVTRIPRTKNGRVRTKRRPPPTTTIPKATRDFVWARDCGRCRVPGCRATRNIAAHHLRFLSHGGDHDPENIVLLCDGHHKLLHSGLLTITGRAPDELTFVRDGKHLVDTRSCVAVEADRTVRALTSDSDAGVVRSDSRPAPRSGPSMRSRFENVVTFEHAKQALMGLGFKARAARAALEEVCAHVGADADVPRLVKAVLDRQRSAQGASVTSAYDMQRDATDAITRLGYTRSLATAAVAAASAHVGAEADLAGLIKDALRRCGSA